MKKIRLLIIQCCMLASVTLFAQQIAMTPHNLEAVDVSVSFEQLDGKEVVKVVKSAAVEEFDEPTFAKIKGLDFTNGTIEIKVLSRLAPDAPDFSRGFIGISFRINEDNTKFENFYLRPTNARSDDQVRRNHSIQYFAFPDYKFQRLREESPEKYESYTDMGLNEWITMRIEIKGNQGKLFINENPQPSLIVNDLKLGSDVSGAIGLWTDIGAEAYFTGLKVIKE